MITQNICKAVSLLPAVLDQPEIFEVDVQHGHVLRGDPLQVHDGRLGLVEFLLLRRGGFAVLLVLDLVYQGVVGLAEGLQGRVLIVLGLYGK